MMERIMKRYEVFFAGPTGCLDRASLLARVSVLFLLAALPFSHNAALKNFALFGMLTAAIWLAVQRRLVVDWRSPILQAIGVLLAVLGVTAALGTDPADSFGELRKHFLPGILLLLLIPQVFAGPQLGRLVLAVIALAFMLRAGLTLIELGTYFPDLDTGRAEGNFIKGFSLDAGFYVPVLVGLLLLGGRWHLLAPVGLLGIFAAMLLTQSRSPLVAVLASLVVMLLVLRRWRPLVLSVIFVAVVASYLKVERPELAEHFASTFQAKNYKGASGVSGRAPIWKGVLEITAPRYLQGYGFGWKKLGQIAMNDGYVARWAAKKNDPYSEAQVSVFSQPPSKVNPHNLYLQIYFESGLLGLAAYALMLLVLFWQSLKIAWCSKGQSRIVAAVLLSYLTGHVILGLANGLWLGLGPSLALVALLEAVRRSEKRA